MKTYRVRIKDLETKQEIESYHIKIDSRFPETLDKRIRLSIDKLGRNQQLIISEF